MSVSVLQTQFTNDLPIFLERQTCRYDDQNKAIGKMIELKIRIYQTLSELMLFQNSFKLGARLMVETMNE